MWLNLTSQSYKQWGWDFSPGVLDGVQCVFIFPTRPGHTLSGNKSHPQMSLMPPIQPILSTHLLSNSPSPPRPSLHWLWFSASFPLSSDETVFEGCGITEALGGRNRYASFPLWNVRPFTSGGKRGCCHFQAHFLPGPLQELPTAHLTWSSCQPWQGGSCVALCWPLCSSEPQFFHLENGGNDNTNLAGWLRGKWDESGARGFGFKV